MATITVRKATMVFRVLKEPTALRGQPENPEIQAGLASKAVAACRAGLV
jgi:hypothetical protein